MWLCTKLGFYSISAKTDTEVHIRARCEQDLINLRRHCTGRVPVASSWPIHKSEPADYRWRIVIHARDLGQVMISLSKTIDYSNFKGIVAGRPDQREKLGIYTAFHHDLEHWQNKKPVGFKLQPYQETVFNSAEKLKLLTPRQRRRPSGS